MKVIDLLKCLGVGGSVIGIIFLIAYTASGAFGEILQNTVIYGFLTFCFLFFSFIVGAMILNWREEIENENIP